MLKGAVTVVQVLHGLFYVLLQLLVVAPIILSIKFYCKFYCSCDPSLDSELKNEVGRRARGVYLDGFARFDAERVHQFQNLFIVVAAVK